MGDSFEGPAPSAPLIADDALDTAGLALRPERTAERGSPFDPLRREGFRTFFASAITGSLAYWTDQFTLGWLVVQIALLEGHAERASLYVGLLGFARFLPSIPIGLLAGVAADRFDRARLQLLQHIGLAAIAFGMGYLVSRDQLTIGSALLGGLLVASALAFDAPSRLSLTQEIAGRTAAFSALSMVRAMRQATGIIGPLIAGVLIVRFGTAGALFAVSILFVGAAVGFSRLRHRRGPVSAKDVHPVRFFLEGLTFVRRDPVLRLLMSLNVALSALALSFGQVLPAFSQDRLDLNALELSWLVSATGLGMAIGAGALFVFGHRIVPSRVIAPTTFVLGALLLVFGLQRSLLVALLLALAIGTLTAFFVSLTSNLIQLRAPGDLRGRVAGLHATVGNASLQFGVLAIGVLGAVIGISNAVVVAGISLVLVAGTADRRADRALLDSTVMRGS